MLSERSQTKIKSTYKGLHVYKVIENTNLSVMIESISVVAQGRSEKGSEENIIKGYDEIF